MDKNCWHRLLSLTQMQPWRVPVATARFTKNRRVVRERWDSDPSSLRHYAIHSVKAFCWCTILSTNLYSHLLYHFLFILFCHHALRMLNMMFNLSVMKWCMTLRSAAVFLSKSHLLESQWPTVIDLWLDILPKRLVQPLCADERLFCNTSSACYKSCYFSLSVSSPNKLEQTAGRAKQFLNNLFVQMSC